MNTRFPPLFWLETVILVDHSRLGDDAQYAISRLNLDFCRPQSLSLEDGDDHNSPLPEGRPAGTVHAVPYVLPSVPRVLPHTSRSYNDFYPSTILPFHHSHTSSIKPDPPLLTDQVLPFRHVEETHDRQFECAFSCITLTSCFKSGERICLWNIEVIA